VLHGRAPARAPLPVCAVLKGVAPGLAVLAVPCVSALAEHAGSGAGARAARDGGDTCPGGWCFAVGTARELQDGA
jgi:hypothetical protein